MTGANHTLESLHRIINYLSDPSTLAEVLYVQMDNCWCEKQNRCFWVRVVPRSEEGIKAGRDQLPTCQSHSQGH